MTNKMTWNKYFHHESKSGNQENNYLSKYLQQCKNSRKFLPSINLYLSQ